MQFEVIGVLASKGQTGGFGNDPDDIVVIPLSTAQYRVMGTPNLNSVSVLASTEAEIPQAQADIQSILRRQHRLTADKKDDFDIRNQAEFLNTFAETTKTFTFLLAGIAAVSLLVGGIGIMNIMLVSVTERTREIGVRKALGATKVAILFQFLIEAIVLCLLGGLVGVVLGIRRSVRTEQARRIQHDCRHFVGGSRFRLLRNCWSSVRCVAGEESCVARSDHRSSLRIVLSAGPPPESIDTERHGDTESSRRIREKIKGQSLQTREDSAMENPLSYEVI